MLATRHGPGVSPDSVVYLSTARSIAQGKGAMALGGATLHPEPMTHFPPGYPAMLAMLRPVTISPLSAVRWLGVLCAGSNLIGICLLARRIAGGTWPALVAGLLTLGSAEMLRNHSFGYAEGPTLVLTLLTFLLLDDYISQPMLWRLLVAAVLTAIACLTRYAAVAVVVTGGLGLIVLGTRPLMRKIRDAVLFGGPPALMLGIWIVRNRRVAGTAASRPIVWHFGSAYQFKTLGVTIREAIASETLRGSQPWIIAFAVLLMALTVALGWNAQRSARNAHRPIFALLFIFLVAHTVMSMVVLEPTMPLDFRLMTPAYVAALLLTVSLFAALSRRTAAARWSATALTILLVVSSLIAICIVASRFGSDGVEFTGIRWRASPVIKHVLQMPPEKLVLSNAPDGILFRDSLAGGWQFDDAKIRAIAPTPLSDDSDQYARARVALRAGAVLLYAEGIRNDQVTEQMLRQHLPIKLAAHDDQGFDLYQYGHLLR